MRTSPAGLLAALMTMVVLFALAGYQVTSETAATRLLSRLGAALMEIDRWLPQHQDDIDLMARDKPEGRVIVADVPVALNLASAEVLAVSGDTQALRTLLVDHLGKTLYADGVGAFRDDGGGQRSLAVTEPVRWTVTMLAADKHGFWQAAVVFCFLLLLALSAAVLMAGGSPLPPLAIGAGVGGGIALGVWLLSVAGRLVIEGPVEQEILLIIRDGAMIGVRNALAVTVAAGGFHLLLSGQRGRMRSTGWRTATPPSDTTSL
jgi:hypothetical protein